MEIKYSKLKVGIYFLPGPGPVLFVSVTAIIRAEIIFISEIFSKYFIILTD